jgi:hypothetical protein
MISDHMREALALVNTFNKSLEDGDALLARIQDETYAKNAVVKQELRSLSDGLSQRFKDNSANLARLQVLKDSVFALALADTSNSVESQNAIDACNELLDALGMVSDLRGVTAEGLDAINNAMSNYVTVLAAEAARVAEAVADSLDGANAAVDAANVAAESLNPIISSTVDEIESVVAMGLATGVWKVVNFDASISYINARTLELNTKISVCNTRGSASLAKSQDLTLDFSTRNLYTSSTNSWTSCSRAYSSAVRILDLNNKRFLVAQNSINKSAADKAAADAKAIADKATADAAVKAAAELKAKQEAEAKAAAELKAKQEAEAKAAAELKAKQEAEAKAAADKVAAELKAKQEAEAQAQLEAERVAAELKAKQEAERVAAELKAKQEAEAKAAADKVAAELKAKQDAEAKVTAAKAAAAKAAAAKAAALKKITITCVKGKLTKKVTAVKPVCPAGYKKK